MGPLVVNEVISENTNLLLAFFIGIAFGFVLEQGGFSSSRKLAGVFYGYDTVVLKVFFTGAITAMLGLLFFSLFGWVDLSLVYVNETFLWSTLVGGVIMGAGFIMGGYCPGTSFCGAAIGKIDAYIFIIGLFIGVFIFGEAYNLLEPLYMAEFWGSPRISEYFGISEGVTVLVVILAAVAMFWGAEWVEKLFPRDEY
ncbi:MAG TPA: YeeE/YedE thiosulfate transporter family protein [Bacteroidales bacterium]|nr:YeeE/YedE thiosulfate transporter family protein [Bacteroidales bacterium]HQQ12443.1 YeeE/YedE thiosulfate transporter family protein [Bacteroidales bacterium]